MAHSLAEPVKVRAPRWQLFGEDVQLPRFPRCEDAHKRSRDGPIDAADNEARQSKSWRRIDLTGSSERLDHRARHLYPIDAVQQARKRAGVDGEIA